MGDLPAGDIQVVIRDGTSDNEYLVKVLSNGEASVGGAVASGATDSGNPIKVGGVFIATPPTLTTGQRGTLQLDANQNLKVNMVSGNSVIQIADGTNIAQKAKVNANGQLYVYIPPSTVNSTLQFNYNDSASTPVKPNQWQDALVYTVPTGYDLGCVSFYAVSAQGGDEARVVNRTTFGTFNTSTGVFTDGSAWSTPMFSAEIDVLVTTLIGGVNNDVVTITYTNQSGVTGRTATVTVPKNSVVGTRIVAPLQSGDFGVMDVTNVTHTVTQAGVIAIEGVISLLDLQITTANLQYEIDTPLNAIVVNQGNSLILQYQSTAPGAKARIVNMVGTLVPRAT